MRGTLLLSLLKMTVVSRVYDFTTEKSFVRTNLICYLIRWNQV